MRQPALPPYTIEEPKPKFLSKHDIKARARISEALASPATSAKYSADERTLISKFISSVLNPNHVEKVEE